MKKYVAIAAVALLGAASAGAHPVKVALNSSITRTQPMTGLVLWPEQAAARHATHGEAVQLEFAYCLPCKVVTGCADDGTIEYDWTWFDRILDDAASRGHQLIARFRYEYPGSKDVDGKTAGMTAVPQYIKNRDDYHETYNKVKGDGATYYADWSNPELQRFTKQFYTDFAERYGSDPRLAFLEVGFGHWSEYHIYGTTLQLGVNFPSKAFQAEFLTRLGDVMGAIPWGVSIDAADGYYSPVPDDKALMALGFGCFDDSFMHKDHEIGSNDGYNEKCWQGIGGATRWQQGFAGGEISYYTDADQKNFLNPEGMYGHTWEEQAAKYHITFMIANDAPEGKYGTGTRFAEAATATGYRLRVKECVTDSDLSETRLLVTNDGVAPLYRNAFFAIGDAVSATSLRGLLPAEERWIAIPAALRLDEGGAPVSAPRIVSPDILPTQVIEYEAATQGGNSGTGTIGSDRRDDAPAFDIHGRPVSGTPRPGTIIIRPGGKTMTL